MHLGVFIRLTVIQGDDAMVSVPLLSDLISTNQNIFWDTASSGY